MGWLCALVLGGAVAFGAQRDGGAVGLADWVEGEVDRVLGDVGTGEVGVEAGEAELSLLFDRLIATVDARSVDALVPVVYGRGLLRAVAESGAADGAGVVASLHAEERFARSLVLGLRGEDDVSAALGVALRLVAERGGRLGEFADLAAAICLVHDGAFTQRVNEVVLESEDAVRLFDYYSRNAGRMRLDPRKTPTDLLIFVVDTTTSVAEKSWALDRYGKSGRYGDRYHEINYDMQSFLRGSEKKVHASGMEYGLRAVLEHGGVCADQAFFASHVAKAAGVPAAYVRGKGAGVAHAWLGYLEVGRRHAAWNFDAGCYEEYQNLEGRAMHPQTRAWVSDNELSLIAGLALRDRAARDVVRATREAAVRLGAMGASGDALGEPLVVSGVRRGAPLVRGVGAAGRLAVLEAGLRSAPEDVLSWRLVGEIARSGAMDVAALESWFGVLDRMCGDDYPYFVVEALEPMIASLEGVAAQSKAWDWAFREYGRGRPDLGSRIRLRQADAWAEAGSRQNAYAGYVDVVERFTDDGPYAVHALARAEALLRSGRRGELVIDLYKDAFGKVERPQTTASAFRAQTNWYKIGSRLMALYREAGMHREAEELRRRMSSG